MCREKFLHAVADYYVKASIKGDVDLSQLCLVFPNKRAAIYFRSYFKQQVTKYAANNKSFITFIPDINTIGAFNERFSEKRVTDNIELIFILYKAYCSVIKERGLEPMAFDRFAFWGYMMLSDFDDIDKEMADAHSLFTNIQRYNEIGSYFLTPEQLEVVESIWGKETAANMQSKSDRFWKHINQDADLDEDGKEKPSTKFLKLWQILDPLYTEFNRLLKEYGNIGYPGLVSREITDIIRNTGLDQLPFKHVGFVGFNMVSTSQAKLMQSLQNRSAADFFWDLLPADQMYAARAGRRIAALNKAFPMPKDFSYPGYDIDKCEIDVYAVPSNSLQAKATGNILQRWKDKDFYQTIHPDNSVIVLPEPALLSSVLNSMPVENIGPVNITMGLSYRETPFASLLHAIVSLHMRCRYIHDKPHYFHEDITAIITHPNLRAVALKSCLALKDYLDRYHQYNVPADVLRDMIKRVRLPRKVQLSPDEILSHGKQELQQIYGADALSCIFCDVPDYRDVSQIKVYIDNLMAALSRAVQIANENINTNAHEVKVLDAYKEAIDHVFDCLHTYRISAPQGSIFAMLDRLLAVSTLNMSGTPLSGLQIMGVLETRALDFENVIVLSMNERIYPRRNRQHSLIPQLLRRAYGLPTTADTEQEYSYYFFRLFSRARRVICLYDSRTSGAGNGAMSRYLLQFKYLESPIKVNYHSCSMFAKQGAERIIVVKKDDNVLAELDAFKSLGPDKLNLSATALKKYRSCKLHFYLEFVKRMREDDTPVAFMDAKTYGSVMHNVLQQLFESQRSTPQSTLPVLIDKNTKWDNKDGILRRVKEEINKLYHQDTYKGRLDYMPAESILLADIMADFIEKILNKEVKYIENNGPFQYVAAEESVVQQWQITPKHKVNFRLDIDRHDILNSGVHRFVDYKTGNDTPHISSISSLFSPNDESSNDACLQLLIYSAAYSDIKNAQFNIQPSIYQLKSAFTDNGMFEKDALTLSQKNIPVIWTNVGQVPDWQQEFRERFEDMINEIFNPEVPFTQTNNIENCRFCKFLQMCARVVPER
jgi:hypothetical protein